MTWTAFPSGQDLAIRAGFTYAVIASVSTSYPKATILAHVPAGVTLLDYAEQGERPGIAVDPNPDHRTVVAMFYATQNAGTLPSKSPWPTTIYQLESAWWSAGQANPNAPAPVAPSSSSGSAWPWVLGTALAGGLAFWGWRTWAQRR